MLDKLSEILKWFLQFIIFVIFPIFGFIHLAENRPTNMGDYSEVVAIVVKKTQIVAEYPGKFTTYELTYKVDLDVNGEIIRTYVPDRLPVSMFEDLIEGKMYKFKIEKKIDRLYRCEYEKIEKTYVWSYQPTKTNNISTDDVLKKRQP